MASLEDVEVVRSLNSILYNFWHIFHQFVFLVQVSEDGSRVKFNPGLLDHAMDLATSAFAHRLMTPASKMSGLSKDAVCADLKRAGYRFSKRTLVSLMQSILDDYKVRELDGDTQSGAHGMMNTDELDKLLIQIEDSIVAYNDAEKQTKEVKEKLAKESAEMEEQATADRDFALGNMEGKTPKKKRSHKSKRSSVGDSG